MDISTKILKPDRLLAWGIEGLLWAYVTILLAWLALRHTSGDRSGLVLSLNYLGVWLFLPLPLLGIWGLSKRKKYRAVLLFVPTGLLLWFYGPLLTPPAPQATNPANSVTILTFNLGYLNANVEALLTTIMATQADVLALQEISPFQQQHLEQALSLQYPYYWHDIEAGMAVYSRYPILTQKNLPMQPWSAQSVVIQVAETPLHLINAHLAPVGIRRYFRTLDTDSVRRLTDNREAQISEIQTAIQETGLPAVIACDCNMTDLMTAYSQVTTTMRDAYRDRGWGLGHTFLIPRGLELRFPFNLPVLRLDYLFYSPEITAITIDIISGDTGSDHLPLVGQFELDKNERLR
ncbi:MAG: endonuclease/exonuclease/phosphatase family protein [Anaerolineae bacterium]